MHSLIVAFSAGILSISFAILPTADVIAQQSGALSANARPLLVLTDEAVKQELLRRLNGGETVRLSPQERQLVRELQSRASPAGRARIARTLGAKASEEQRALMSSARRQALAQGAPRQAISLNLARSLGVELRSSRLRILPAGVRQERLFLKERVAPTPTMPARIETAPRSQAAPARRLPPILGPRGQVPGGGAPSEHRTGFDPGLSDEGRPKVVRYSCCDDVEIRSGAALTQPVVGSLSTSEPVWVFDILGTGAPGGIGQCGLSSLASCGTLWGEVHVPDQNLSGYAHLNALFVRPLRPQVGEVRFEIGYGKLAEYLQSGIETALVAPQGCGSPGNTVTMRGSDFGHHDFHFNPLSQTQSMCSALLEQSCSYEILECEEIESGQEGFGNCVYATLDECESGERPGRSPRSDLHICVKTCPVGQGTCGDCREWYADTGQDQAGWMTQNRLVDQCLADIDTDLCAQAATAGGAGVGQRDALVAPNLGAAQPRDDANDDPLPQRQARGGLTAGGATQAAASGCTAMCQSKMETFKAAMCGRYVGPVDERRFGDPKDYECGEVPIGRTHPGHFQDTATGEMTGSPNATWKRLAEFNLPGDKTASVSLGRKPKQRAFTFSNLDLTTGAARRVDAPATMDARDVWLAFHPDRIEIEGRLRDVLLVDACVHLPGNEIDGGSVTYNPTDPLFSLVREINLGNATIQRAKVCALARFYLDDDHKPRSDWLEIYELEMPITDLNGVDIKWGPGAIAAQFVPFGELVHSAIMAVELAETHIAHSDRLKDSLPDKYSFKIIDWILPEVEAAVEDGLNGLDINPRERLQSVCAQLDPGVSVSHPFHYFYRFLRAHCEGFTSSHVMRAFQTNDASVEAGCYARGAFITPADAGKNRWWAQYGGQKWAFPLWPDSGCRLGATMASRLDESVWPTLVCAAMTFNAWHNNGPQPAGASLREMVSANCSAYGVRALEDYYGNGQDLIDLYRAVHAPSGPTNEGGGFQAND